jgi:hypothetical protein
MTDEVPQRYWVLRPFLHYEHLKVIIPVISCGICGAELLRADTIEHDIRPLVMFQDAPLCPKDALAQLSEHPMTPEYLRWMEEGDPRWWSPWFCDCDGCDPFSPLSPSDGAGSDPARTNKP